MTEQKTLDPYNPRYSTDTSSVVLVDGETKHIDRPGGTWQADSTPPEVKPGSVIDRAVSRGGAPRLAGRITEDDIVSVSGIQMRIGDALQTGMMRQNQDGTFELVSKFERQEAARKAGAGGVDGGDDRGGMEALAPDVENQITEVAQTASPSDVISVISDYTKDGNLNEGALGRIASAMGIEPGEAHGRFNNMVGAFERQARLAVSKMGVDPDAVFEWASTARSQDFQEAMKQQATQRTTKGYQALAQSYVANLEKIDPDSILNAQLPEGVTARRLQNGKIVLKAGNTEIGWTEAVRMGAVKISRAG